MKKICLLNLAAVSVLLITPVLAVEFPGSQPGDAKSLMTSDSFTLKNAAISMSWKFDAQTLRPKKLTNQLTGKTFDQSGAELFRIATKPAENPTENAPGVVVGFRLNSETISVVASRDGSTWTELKSYPRDDKYQGEPKLVRIGKMNLKAQAKDNPDLGPEGEGSITELNPLPASIPGGSFNFKSGAHQATTTEYSFPAGAKWISCRIDKGTDQGLSWSPAVALIWEDGTSFVLAGLRAKDEDPLFNLTTQDGEKEHRAKLANAMSFDTLASEFRLKSKPRLVKIKADANGTRVAERLGGYAVEAEMISKSGLRAQWQAELRDGSSYIRQTVVFSVSEKSHPLLGLALSEARFDDAIVIGRVPGCPVAGSGIFLGVEIPGSMATIGEDLVKVGFSSQLKVTKENSYSFSSVTGVAPEQQLRRAFLFYIERERARPTKQFLHYNCWYDLGYEVDEESMMDVVKAFDKELVKKRGVNVDSYLVDDGWDSPDKGLWVDNLSKFPDKLSGLNKKMSAYDAKLSIWISPLGGYGGAKERTEWARKQGLIPADAELDLSHPLYKKWYVERCLELMKDSGVNAFKWDRAGEGVSPHFMALLDVSHELREADPNLFLNVTVGTWPSPFWLNHVDTTWRNGSADVGWLGKGDDREKWLTFRDSSAYDYFVKVSPLYPLNSAMHHGLVHGRAFQGDKVGKAGTDLKNEARSYFGTGATLQELYLTPSMMTEDGWNRVAEAAKWAQANADVLVDAHWVGGDPNKLEPYGYAAWIPGKATLMLRNPDDTDREIYLDASKVFELPKNAAQDYMLHSPYQDQRVMKIELSAGKPTKITLKPFEVLVFNAKPKT